MTDADPGTDWVNINGDRFVDMLLEHAQLCEFVDLYQRNGFENEFIRQLIWSKSGGRWRPMWETVESIADDQRKAGPPA